MRFMILVKTTEESAPGVEGEIEVRRLMDLDDFGDGYDVDRFRALDLPSQQEVDG